MVPQFYFMNKMFRYILKEILLELISESIEKITY